MIFDHFDRIRIINLPHRTDRRREMEGELRRVGLMHDPRVAFFAARSFEDRGDFSSRGARGVFASHLDLLREAEQARESLLILEDDCDFSPTIAQARIEGPCDVYYGGHHALGPGPVETVDIAGAHMMGFSAAVLPDLVRFLSEMQPEADGIRQPIDGAYVSFRRAHPLVTAQFALPPIGMQRASRTDIATPKLIDRLPVIRNFAGLARRVKRTIRPTFGR